MRLLNRVSVRWANEGWFRLVFIAGPIFWVALLLTGVPRKPGWPGAEVILFVVVLSPVLEELVFRSGMQAWLFNKPMFRREPFIRLSLISQISYANLLTSIVFAAFHTLAQPLIWAASVFFPSLVFGWARDRTGSVLPAMVLHAWYNLGFVVLFVR